MYYYGMRFFLVFCINFFLIFELSAESKNVLKLTCEYDPELIQKKKKNIGFVKKENIDLINVCKTFGCKDIIEVNEYKKTDNKIEYRLRNSWFNHQGILLEDFIISDNTFILNTFVSQAYYLETYSIDKISGKTKRTFYRFDSPDFYYEIKEIEENKKNSLYNKKGMISLKKLKSFSLQPWEVFYFEGKCQRGIGV